MVKLGSRVRLAGQASQTGLWVDHDACSLDGHPVNDWQAVLGRLEEVRGAYALAHSDGQRLFLARDPVGERTLYYTREGHFASRLQDLPHSHRLDPLGLVMYLSCAYVPGASTMVEGVFELLPGEWLEFSQGDVRQLRRWEPSQVESESSEEELREELRARLEEAVRRRLPAQGEVGCTLSGGIDSSLVAALAQKEREVRTWSLSFGPDYANELPFSSAVAAHCGTRHRVVELSPAQVLARLDEVPGWLSKPNGDPLTIPNALLFEEASREVEVVLNGEGGDPCFGGPKNLPMLLSELYSPGDREAHYLRSHLKCYDDLEEMLAPELWEAVNGQLEAWLAPHLRAPGQSLVQKLMRLNLAFKGAHHILPKVDAISYPFGVLPRSPLFDRDLVELAFRIPAQLKLRGSVEKYLLKEAVRDLLPTAVVERPKSGMLVPVEAWFSGPLLGEARTRLLDGLAPRGLFRRDFLERLLDGRLGGLRPRRGVKIWLLLNLECWLRARLDR